jgi:hypothetical protein
MRWGYASEQSALSGKKKSLPLIKIKSTTYSPNLTPSSELLHKLKNSGVALYTQRRRKLTSRSVRLKSLTSL